MQFNKGFQGGVGSKGHFKRMKKWFYYGFKRRHKLSRRKTSSIGQKLPKDWEEKHQSIISRIARHQTPVQRADGSFIPGADDDHVGNSDHVPTYVEPHGLYTWGKREVHGRRSVKTGGKEKERFTTQLTVFKSGRKGRPYIIFKAVHAPTGKKHGNKNSVTYEIYHNLPDQWGNHYPSREKCEIVVSKTANSNQQLTLDIVEKVFWPELGINEDGQADHVSVMLMDDFKGHSAEIVKEKTLAVKDHFKWEIMAGGITPKAQPLDVLINKVWKGFFRDLFEEWSLNAPLNEKSGNPIPPSRQLLAQWVVMSWEKIPESLVKKAWEVCGYKSSQELNDEAEGGALVTYSKKELAAFVEETMGEEASEHFLYDPENKPLPMFPDDDDDDEEEDSE